MKQANILIVEDEALVAEDLKSHICDMGHQVSAMIPRGEDALTLLKGSRPDLVLMDVVLAGTVDGIDVAQVIKEQYNIPVIYLTAYTDTEKLERATATEPYGYLVKPFDERELRTTISMALYKAEADRNQRKNLLWTNAVLTSITDAVITIDRNSRVRYLNTAAEQLTGWKKQSACNHGLHEVMRLPDEQQASLTALIAKLQASADRSTSINTLHTEILLEDGTSIPVEISVGNIHYDDGSQDGIVIAFRDVTLQRQARDILQQTNTELESRVQQRTRELQQANRELDTARQRAEAASEAKSRFLTNMSHELRTPLNAIIGYAEIWKHNPALLAKQHDQADDVYSAGMQLLSIIDDILEIAESDTGELQFQSEPIDLASLVHHIEIGFQESCKKKGLQFVSALPATPPPIVLGDPVRLREILKRLLDNALKFTPSGKLELKLAYSEASENSLLTRFTVTDTGIGVNDKTRIFELLTQLDDGLTRRSGGIGMGLTIARRLVELMGGQIGVDDNPGGGSQFWFELKLPLLQE